MIALTTLALLLAALLASKPYPAAAGEPAPAPTDRANRLACPPAPAAIPPALEHLESAAEDIGDAVANGDWTRASNLVQAATRDLDTLAQQGQGKALLQARLQLDQTRQAVEGRRPLEAQFAANALSGAVVALYAGYQPVVPVEVMRLDVLLRQAQLDGLAGKPADALEPLAEARALWDPLRTQPPLASTAAANQFERDLAAVEQAASAGDAAALARTAGSALEAVDGLERVYEQTGG